MAFPHFSCCFCFFTFFPLTVLTVTLFDIIYLFAKIRCCLFPYWPSCHIHPISASSLQGNSIMVRPSRNSSTGKVASSSSSTTPSPLTRTSKRKAGGGSSSAASSPAGGNAKTIKVTHGDELPPPPPLPPQEEEEAEQEDEVPEDPQDTEKRQQAIELLRLADDLPSAYAALKLVKEIGNSSGVGRGNNMKRIIAKMSAEDQELIHNASLAVPYLMYKLCVEEFTQPRAQGGLAYSHAKAVEIASILFEKAGPACCCITANITELQLVKKCNSTSMTKNDARKVMPILKKIGIEARSKLDETIAKLETAPPPTPPEVEHETKEIPAEENEVPQETTQQSTEEETKVDVTSSNEEEQPQQKAATQLDEAKVGGGDGERDQSFNV